MANSVATIIETLDVTISDGTSISAGTNLRGRILVGVRMSASWTTANLTFQECDTVDGTYQDLYDTTGEVAITTVASSRTVMLPPETFLGVKNIKLRSGTSASPVNQSGDHTITLLLGAPDGP